MSKPLYVVQPAREEHASDTVEPDLLRGCVDKGRRCHPHQPLDRPAGRHHRDLNVVGNRFIDQRPL